MAALPQHTSDAFSGIMNIKWYRKESSRSTLIHANSSHTLAIKRVNKKPKDQQCSKLSKYAVVKVSALNQNDSFPNSEQQWIFSAAMQIQNTHW